MTLGSHQATVGASQSNLTPRWIIEALGHFDLDPCAAHPRPWDCADHNVIECGLSIPWHGRVWLNPPFDRYKVGKWIERLSRHGDGIALLHARTEATWFEPVWDRADAILFLADRIKFCRPDGTEQRANSGAPAVLVAFGEANVVRLRTCGIRGFLTEHWIRVGYDPAANSRGCYDLALASIRRQKERG